MIAFKKTIINQKKFCKFIEQKYKTDTMIENIHDSELFLQYVKRNTTKSKNKILYNLLNNLRMTICELG